MSLIFRPLFEKESSTYSYLLADSQTKEAITKQRDIGLIEELDLPKNHVIMPANKSCGASIITQ